MGDESWCIVSFSSSLWVLVALAALGCGDSFSESPSSTSGGSAGSGAISGTAGSAGVGGTAGGGGVGGTGGASGTAGTAGGPDDRIDPILLGRSWTYDVTELGSYPLCPSGAHTAETISETDLDGRHAFEVTSLCANAPSSFYSVEGDVVLVNYQHTWVLALDAPVEAEHTWSNGASTFTWHSEGKYAVPAATFDRCWNATENVDHESFTVFCRGVGPVHWHSKDPSGNGFDARLTAKSF